MCSWWQMRLGLSSVLIQQLCMLLLGSRQSRRLKAAEAPLAHILLMLYQAAHQESCAVSPPHCGPRGSGCQACKSSACTLHQSSAGWR